MKKCQIFKKKGNPSAVKSWIIISVLNIKKCNFKDVVKISNGSDKICLIHAAISQHEKNGSEKNAFTFFHFRFSLIFKLV